MFLMMKMSDSYLSLKPSWLKRLICLGFSLLIASNCLSQAHFLDTEDVSKLQSLIESPTRSEAVRSRNSVRHPLQTLDFFQVTDQLKVVEIWPGGQGGWYRSILQPYLARNGSYIPLNSSSDFPDSVEAVADNSVDTVLVFRAHGFMIYDNPAQQYYDAIYKMLNSGGIFGIVDHRGDEAIAQDPKGHNGYVNQSHVISLAEKAGFILVAQAEINANALDKKNHPDGVYSLPPTLRGSLINRRKRARMLAIGESDRMTLKFTKP